MTTSNGSISLAENPPQTKCYGCGQTVYLQFQDAVMEVLVTTHSPQKQTVVWHQNCYEHFLDQRKEC